MESLMTFHLHLGPIHNTSANFITEIPVTKTWEKPTDIYLHGVHLRHRGNYFDCVCICACMHLYACVCACMDGQVYTHLFKILKQKIKPLKCGSKTTVLYISTHSPSQNLKVFIHILWNTASRYTIFLYRISLLSLNLPDSILPRL
jgi:hypothetical protein